MGSSGRGTRHTAGAAAATARLLAAPWEPCGGSSALADFPTFQSTALLALMHAMQSISYIYIYMLYADAATLFFSQATFNEIAQTIPGCRFNNCSLRFQAPHISSFLNLTVHFTREKLNALLGPVAPSGLPSEEKPFRCTSSVWAEDPPALWLRRRQSIPSAAGSPHRLPWGKAPLHGESENVPESEEKAWEPLASVAKDHLDILVPVVGQVTFSSPPAPAPAPAPAPSGCVPGVLASACRLSFSTT